MKLTSRRFNGKWYKTAYFSDHSECSACLEANSEYGLLLETVDNSGDPIYIIARTDDLGTDKLDIRFESEDSGFCKRFYRSACGRLFVLIPDGLFTCNDDAWREACSPVRREFFTIHD